MRPVITSLALVAMLVAVAVAAIVELIVDTWELIR